MEWAYHSIVNKVQSLKVVSWIFYVDWLYFTGIIVEIWTNFYSKLDSNYPLLLQLMKISVSAQVS